MKDLELTYLCWITSHFYLGLGKSRDFYFPYMYSKVLEVLQSSRQKEKKIKRRVDHYLDNIIMYSEIPWNLKNKTNKTNYEIHRIQSHVQKPIVFSFTNNK